MKKILAIILSASLLFVLTACNTQTKVTDTDISEVSQSTNSKGDVSEENSSDNSNKNSASTLGQSNNKNNNGTNQSTQNNSSKNNTTNNSLQNIDNGVLKNATSQKMSVPVNMELLSTDDASEENNSENTNETVALYELDGDVVNWTTVNDFVYIITSGNNRLVVINSKTMMAVYNVPLAGKPAEMNIIGNKIYISMPDLKRIDIFSKSSVAKISSLYFDHEVSSFCIDGNYIYYSTHDQHCDVYKKNTATNELTKIIPDRGYTFYQPKIYLNKQDNILYIGETGSSGSTLYYYNATTLELKSLFRKNNYGIMNHTRDIFHVGNDIIWGNYRLSDTNANQIIGRYGEAGYGSVNFASNELVSTFEGIFLADTFECIVDYYEAEFPCEYWLVTKSYNFFFRARSSEKNIILGLNFDLQ